MDGQTPYSITYQNLFSVKKTDGSFAGSLYILTIAETSNRIWTSRK